MNSRKLVIRNLFYYRKKNFTVILGIAIATAVLIGALIVGDSVTNNLKRIAQLRLGKIEFTLNSGERYFTNQLADKLQSDLNTAVSPLLLLEGMAIAEGGVQRVNNIQILGVDSSFGNTFDTNIFLDKINPDEVIINTKLAGHLNVNPGDEILFRIKKASLIPLNAPFVSDDELTVTARLKIKKIAGDDDAGRFNLRISQTGPYSAFVSIDLLNQLMDLTGKANILLISQNTSLTGKYILETIGNNWTIEDAGLIIRELPESGEIEILSERVFFDQSTLDALQAIPVSENLVFTYFVNEFSSGSNFTPYSFVSTFPDSLIGQNEVIVNQWLADDLNLKIGDSLNMKYFTVGPLRKLLELKSGFVVKNIVPIKDRFADENLMPVIPGLSDAGNCRDWETGIPINLDKIRDKDEDYWNIYKGVPKAFIAQSKAVDLWRNLYGSYTAVRFNANEINPDNLKIAITKNLNPASLGFVINEVSKNSSEAATQGVDFSQLFMGLSFFVFLSAIILTILLLFLNLDGRKEQLETMSALGISKNKIHWIMNLESLILSASGALIGVILAILYTLIIFSALNGVWMDIVRTEMMQIYVSVPTLLKGFFLSMLVCWLTLFFTIRRFLNKKSAKYVDLNSDKKSFSFNKLILIISVIGLAISITLIISQIMQSERINAEVFFIAGGLILISVLLIFFELIKKAEGNTFRKMDVFSLGIRNSIRNKGRSISIVSLLAIGTFVVFSTGTNRKDLFIESTDKTSGTGGFQFYSESTIPIVRDLNDAKVRLETGLSEDINFVQISKAEGDDASCLNLNRISNPQILAVNPQNLEGRFKFISETESIKNVSWLSLDIILPENIIPAIADETVIKWGLGKKAGDTLTYTDDYGNIMKLKLIGGIANSIFQGNIIISDKQFLKHFPDISGSNIFLIDGITENIDNIESELGMIFRDYGWEMKSAVQRLAEFNSVENTYLSIFMVMGAFAILIGTIGMGIVLARSILERKKEISLFKAIGISSQKILSVLLTEYLFLLISGILIGVLTSIIATLPSLLSPGTEISISSILLITVILLINGFIWIWFLAKIFLRNPAISQALRND